MHGFSSGLSFGASLGGGFGGFRGSEVPEVGAEGYARRASVGTEKYEKASSTSAGYQSVSITQSG